MVIAQNELMPPGQKSVLEQIWKNLCTADYRHNDMGLVCFVCGRGLHWWLQPFLYERPTTTEMVGEKG